MEGLSHLGDQRQRHFARGLAEAVEPDGGMEPRQRLLGNAVAAQLGDAPVEPHPRPDRADIERLRSQRRGKPALVVLAVVREDGDGGPPVGSDGRKRRFRVARW